MPQTFNLQSKTKQTVVRIMVPICCIIQSSVECMPSSHIMVPICCIIQSSVVVFLSFFFLQCLVSSSVYFGSDE